MNSTTGGFTDLECCSGARSGDTHHYSEADFRGCDWFSKIA
jgi:hypothetical protein